MASSDAKPVPQKNVAYRVTFPIFDADGDPVTGASGLDSEVSKDGGTFADCTNEATEIATSSGIYYLDLTSTEMNADTVAICVKTSTSGAKTTVMVLYPEEAGDIRVNATAMSGTALTARDIGASVLLSSGTGTGQVTLTSGRVNADLTHIATAAVSTSTAQLGVNVVNFGGSAGAFASGRPEVNTTHAAGTAWGSGAITAASIAASALNGKGDWNVGKTDYTLSQAFPTNFSSLAITAGGLVDITQTAADKAWSTATRVLTAGTNIALAKGVGVTGFTDIDATGIRTAVGLASANLDTQIADLPTVSEVEARTIVSANYATAANLATVAGYLDTEIAAILEDTGATIPAQISALSIPTTGQIAAALLAAGDVDGFSIEQTLKLCLAALAGKLSGAAGTTITILAADDSKARITATVDADGNRTAITLDAAG